MTLNMSIARRPRTFQLAFLLLLLALRASLTSAQTQLPKFDFQAVHYDVQATLHPAEQNLTAEAKVELVAKAASRTILVELHPDLHLDAVKLAIDGRKLDFQRDSFNPLDLEVTLPSMAQPGMHVTLIFDYSGAFANDDDSPTKDVRFAWIDRNSAYLLLPARWFPLTNYPSNRYTATFQITVPENFAVTGTGQSSTPNSLPAEKPGESGRSVYTFNCKDAAAVGTFVAGNLQLAPVHAQGLDISVFAPPAASATAPRYGDELANVLTYYSNEFGPLSSPHITLAQLPDGTVDSFSAPGLLLLSARDWGTTVNRNQLAHLSAEQWWGNQVLPASPGDAWVTDGLAQYVAAMYIEHTQGEQGFRRELTSYAVGSVMFEGATPIAQAQDLQPYSQQYESIVVDKGAMVFHMLRTSMGDATFDSLLHDFYAAHAGKTASIEDFEKVAEAKLPSRKTGQPHLNLIAFFSQWLDSTGIPEFKLDYIVYRTPKGFKVVGKVTQPLETFNMPVEIRVNTEGNPVTKSVQVIGTSTPFDIDTFGRPKPDGILDRSGQRSAEIKPETACARSSSRAVKGSRPREISRKPSSNTSKRWPCKRTTPWRIFGSARHISIRRIIQRRADSFRIRSMAISIPVISGRIWSHIYLGKIFDLTGSRERAINEYQKAEELKDNTGGAQQEAEKYMKSPYTAAGSTPAATKPEEKPAKP